MFFPSPPVIPKLQHWQSRPSKTRTSRVGCMFLQEDGAQLVTPLVHKLHQDKKITNENTEVWTLVSTFLGKDPGEMSELPDKLQCFDYIQTEKQPPPPMAKPGQGSAAGRSQSGTSGPSALKEATRSSSPFDWMLELRNRQLTQHKITYIARELLKTATEMIVALDVTGNNLGAEIHYTLYTIHYTLHTIQYTL